MIFVSGLIGGLLGGIVIGLIVGRSIKISDTRYEILTKEIENEKRRCYALMNERVERELKYIDDRVH